IPVLRREGNLVARASTGSGKTLAYALGVLDRLQPTESAADEGEDTGDEGEEEEDEGPASASAEVGTRFLVLVPTAEAAERIALSLVPYVQSVELGITVAGGNWGTPLGHAEVLVAAPADVLEAVSGSALKLEALEAVVLDGASDIHALGGWEAVETILDHAPRDAQRVVITSTFNADIDDLVDRRVKRALRYPPQPAVPDAEEPAPLEGNIGYALVPERQKVDTLARLLGEQREREQPPVLFCRTDERAAEVAEALTLRGFLVGEVDDADADVAVVAAGTTRAELAEEGATVGRTISYDVPADERVLAARHGGDRDALILLESRELAHLRDTAQRARLRPLAVTLPEAGAGASAELTAFRREMRRALREEDLGAQLLVLEPLFEEFSPLEVAAAATALLRRRRPAASAEAAPTPSAQPAERAARPAAERATPSAGAAPATWARLYVGVGSRDGIRPGDIVGAIAGEADIPGASVGKIEIRDTFSIVEVQADAADRVIRAVNGTSIKGRSVRVDYDRAADRTRKPGGPPRREGGPRSGPGGPRGGGTGGPRTGMRRPRPSE
ncbi:MAG: DbpA RNA binding domain-containing protein, partial [Gemmatimonadetes bacterium]|nr:DbpA RNA binding domain-containing protein [Gemmatimonadota bacterium]